MSQAFNPFDPGYYGSEELRSFGFKSVGGNVLVARNCTIIGIENIELSDHCRIDGYCTIIAAGGWLRIGRYVHVHTSVVIGARGGVELGDYCGVSHGSQILSASDDFTGRWMTNSTLPEGCTKPTIAPIRIGRHVPIGTCCTILPGVTIGEGAALCSHSLVTRDVPEWVMVAGAPAEMRSRRNRRVLALAPQEMRIQAA
jgi:galactoside O-acetyltransferase